MSSSHDNESSGQDKQFTVIVNGQQKTVTQKELTFAQVVALAFPAPSGGANTIYTVTFRKGEGNKPEGTLVNGEDVKVKDGMIFNVTATDKS